MSNGNTANNNEKNGDPTPTDIPVQKAQVLWDEYKYRHDLVWRVVFQITTATVILSVAPYLAPENLDDYLGLWLLAAPLLACVLVIFSMEVVNNELEQLGKIRSTHRCLQEDLFREYGLSHKKPEEGQEYGLSHKKPEEGQESSQSSQSSFTSSANYYLLGLAALSAANIGVCGLFWIYGCVVCRNLWLCGLSNMGFIDRRWLEGSA